MDTDVEGFEISLPVIATTATVAAGLFLATVLMAVRQRSRPVVTGREQMVGATGEALDAFGETGRVRVHGEVWNARSGRPVEAGAKVRITNVEGLTLDVEPTDEETGT